MERVGGVRGRRSGASARGEGGIVAAAPELVDSAKLHEILSLLFNEREAFVASRFPLMEATLEELCGVTAIAAAAS